MEQSDKLVESLLKQARIRAAGVGGESKVAIEDIAKGTGEHAKRAGFLVAASTMFPWLAGSAKGDLEAIGKAATATTEAVTQLAEAVATDSNKIAEAREAAAAKAEALANKIRAAAEKDAAEEAQLQKQISDIKMRITIDELEKLAALHAEIMGQIRFEGMPNVSMPFEGLNDKEKKTLNQLGVLTDDAERHAENVQQAIWGSAQQVASTIVSALNIGGGGRGSNIGGSIGGTAGFALGYTFGGGPVGGAIGSLIGNVAGSFLGGLFDSNKKSVDNNTQALRANTAALLLNSPSGYKTAGGRFAATDVKGLRRDLQRYATRGGAPVLVTP